LFTWKIASRVFKKRDKRFFTTIAVIIFVLSIPIIFSGEFALLLAIISLAFITYVLSSTEPEEVTHKLIAKGVDYGGKFYAWEDLKVFFFTEKEGRTTLCFDTKKYYPGRLLLLVEKKDMERIKKIASEYLPYVEEPPVTVLDKISAAASKYLSLG